MLFKSTYPFGFLNSLVPEFPKQYSLTVNYTLCDKASGSGVCGGDGGRGGV